MRQKDLRDRDRAGRGLARQHVDSVYRRAPLGLLSPFEASTDLTHRRHAAAFSLKLEKLRAMMALEVQRSQQLVAEAKEETARARLECLQVHEQSLHIHEQTAVRHGRAKP